MRPVASRVRLRAVRRAAVIVLTLTALAACGSAGGAAAVSGVVRGTVTRGPTEPLCRTGVPCSEPAAGVVLVFRRLGATVRTRTDARGRYRVALAPGLWRLALTGTGIGTALQPASVRVVAGRVHTVEIAIDTGIR